MNRMIEAIKPVDLAPLIAAITASKEPDGDEAPTPIVVNVTTPDVIVNAPVTVTLPEQPANVVNIAPASITVESPTVNVAAPAITVEAPAVTIAAPAITVEAPIINVQPAPSKAGIKFETNAAGDITGASLS